MKGICIKQGASTNLKEGEQYFLFEHGPDHYYASRFNHKGAHFGAFERKLFDVFIERAVSKWPPEPPCIKVSLDNSKVYKAEMIWRDEAYKNKPLGIYYIRPVKTHCWFYFDSQMKKPGGCYPLHWFDGFQEHDPEMQQEIVELPKNEWEQMRLF
ncbi:hypothetical protein [Rummeliibacillus stabekisii]|uniref:hypothetical protein n=1 Tax=Rummeliibacillus stabekisii TaxID=241244 RepID=UPI00371C4699